MLEPKSLAEGPKRLDVLEAFAGVGGIESHYFGAWRRGGALLAVDFGFSCCGSNYIWVDNHQLVVSMRVRSAF